MDQDYSLEQVAESEKRAKRLAVVGVALSMVVLLMVMVAVSFMVSGLKRTVDELSVELNRKEADAMLASANVVDATNVSVPVLYYDQVMDDCAEWYEMSAFDVARAGRQFEWAKCNYYNYKLETGLVEGELSEEYLPVAVGAGETLMNRAINTENFTRWFSTVEGKSKVYTRMLQLIYDAENTTFSYENNEFYPLNDVEYDKTEVVNADGKNHLFTMNLGVPVQILGSGEEEFEITSDDDTWAFVGKRLVLDMGGVHDEMTGRIKIAKNGEVYSAVENEELAYSGTNVAVGEGTIIRVFHADRNSENSVMKLTFRNMVLNITNTTLARGDGVEVAYDPANPGYVAPLGESMTVKADRTRGLIFALTAQLAIFGALAMVFAYVIVRVLRKVQ